MAMTSYRIISVYSPYVAGGEPNARASDVLAEVAEQDRVWSIGPTYRSADGIHVSDRAAHPPRFVPEIIEADEESCEEPLSSHLVGRGISEWYRTISHDNEGQISESELSSLPSSPYDFGASHVFLRSTPNPSSPSLTSHRKERKSMREGSCEDWFIHGALFSTASPSASPPFSSSLTDMLSRAPPPLPSQARYEPPARTKLGPANRGYAILSKNGWREGQGLGSWRTPSSGGSRHTSPQDTKTPYKSAHIDGRTVSLSPKVEQNRRSSSGSAHVSGQDGTIQPTGYSAKPEPEVIDLTCSSDEDSGGTSLSQKSCARRTPNGTVLLAPLPVYIKRGRLGIGASPSPSNGGRPRLKVLTHTSQAFFRKDARHRRGNLESGVKRGAKAHSRVRREEARQRSDFFAYMNS